MRLNRTLALGASMLALISACTTGGGSSPSPSAAASANPSTAASPSAAGSPSAAARPKISIGSEKFYESKLVAEMYAQVLEKAGYTVERNLGIGDRAASATALDSNQIQVKPEYIGSGLGYYKKAGLTQTDPSGDSAANAAALQAALKAKGITVLDFSPGQDSNAFVVRKDTQQQYNLTKIGDLAAVADKLTWGLPPECKTNPLCGGALKDAYGIDVSKQKVTPLAACDAPIANALKAGTVDVAELCSTQPAIGQFGFVQLEDDKHTQPAENMAPLIRDDWLATANADEVKTLLNGVSKVITTEALTTLGIQVAVDNKDVADVARDFLTQAGLLK